MCRMSLPYATILFIYLERRNARNDTEVSQWKKKLFFPALIEASLKIVRSSLFIELVYF